MISVTTTKVINLDQLDRELGRVGLVCRDDGTTRVVGAPDDNVTQAQLQAAVDAHVAVDRDANGATLRRRAQNALATNATFLGLASPSNAQNAAQVKALTRQMNGLVRLVVGLLDDITNT